MASVLNSLTSSAAWTYKKGAQTKAIKVGSDDDNSESLLPGSDLIDEAEEFLSRSVQAVKTEKDEFGNPVRLFDCCSWFRPPIFIKGAQAGKYDMANAEVWQRCCAPASSIFKLCNFCCNCIVDDETKPKQVYDAFQATLQTYIMVTTLLMGFVVTGAFVSVSWSGDETFSQDKLVHFVGSAMWAFAWAMCSFAVSLAISLIAQQIMATRNLAGCAVKFFKLCAPCMFFAEVLMYLCAFETAQFLQQYLKLNYVAPTKALCVGDWPGGRGDSFCAQLGNDMYEAAKELPECNRTKDDYVKSTDPWQQAEHARIFKVDSSASTEEKQTSVCNQLDWYPIGDPEHDKVTMWFGYMAYGPKYPAWRSKAYVDSATVPVASNAEFNDATIVENNGKILGEAMCGKNVAANDMKNACPKEKRCEDPDKKPEDCNHTRCDTAQTAYLAADDCADGKFQDTMKCFRACNWGASTTTNTAKYTSKYSALESLKFFQKCLKWFFGIRCFLFGPWYLYTLCMMAYEYRNNFNEYVANTKGEEMQTRFNRGAIVNLTVETLNIENKSAPELVGPPVAIPPLVPSQPPITTSRMVEQPSMTTVGVDLNHDGRPDIYYSGADRNHDGVPDALQGGSGLFTSRAGLPTPGLSSSASYPSLAPTSVSRPFTSGAVI